MYKIKGADQKEYGPVSADQIRQWVRENRLNRFSLAESTETPGWKPLESIAEFADLFASTVPPAAAGGGWTSSTSQAAPMASGYPAYGAGPASPVINPAEAAAKLKLPATILIVFAILGLLMTAVSPFTKKMMVDLSITVTEKLFELTQQPMPAQTRDQLEASRNQGFGLSDGFMMVMSLATNAVMLIGALKMKNLESWGFALASAILVMLPCGSCCCCLGLGVGIWAAVLLSKPEIKGAFRA